MGEWPKSAVLKTAPHHGAAKVRILLYPLMGSGNRAFRFSWHAATRVVIVVEMQTEPAEYRLDRFDVALLVSWPEKGYAFPKTDAKERRASDLARHGYMEREMRRYGMARGGHSVTWKWAYRLTDKGRGARSGAA